MGGRGKGGAGRSRLAVEKSFNEMAENVFVKYGLERQGGVLLYERRPPPRIREWIKANKNNLIRWKQNIDQENEKTEKRFKTIKDLVFVTRSVKEGREFFKIQVPVLKQEGLRKKIDKRIEPDIYGVNAKQLWSKLNDQLGIQDTFTMDRNSIKQILSR